jgi:hypothetical protein
VGTVGEKKKFPTRLIAPQTLRQLVPDWSTTDQPAVASRTCREGFEPVAHNG